MVANVQHRPRNPETRKHRGCHGWPDGAGFSGEPGTNAEKKLRAPSLIPALEGYFNKLLILLWHKRNEQQKGHLGRAGTSEWAKALRMVAMEYGWWRSGRRWLRTIA